MLSLATEASELLRQRRYTESRAAFLRLTNLPLFADQGYLGLGMIALRIGDPHAARWQFLHALRCNPGYAPAHDALRQLEAGQPTAGFTPPANPPAHPAAANSRQPGGAPDVTAARPLDQADTRPAGRGGLPLDLIDARPAGRGRLPVGDLGSYEYLRSDTSLLGQHVTAALAALPGRRRGSAMANAGRLTLLATVLSAMIAAAIGAGRVLDVELPLPALFAAGGLIWCIAVLRVRTTVHDLSGGRLTIERGLVFRRVTRLELWQVRCIERRRTLLDRITGHGELRFTAEGPDRQVLRARGLARRSRLRDLHAHLSDLVFLLRSSPPDDELIGRQIDWPINGVAHAAAVDRMAAPLRRVTAGQHISAW